MKTNEDLKLVIAVRHGEYTNHGQRGLNDLGRQQSQLFATKLRAIIPQEYSVEIFSSILTRGQETAEILASHLGATTKMLYELCSDDFIDGEEKRQAILKSVNGSDAIVIVAHYTSPSGIINAFSEYHFKKQVSPQETKKGNGLMLDLCSGKVVTDLMDHTS